MHLIKNDLDNGYKLYKLPYIVENKSEFIKDSYDAIERFKIKFVDSSSTWAYKVYNVFSLSGGSILFYNLFKELNIILAKEKINNEPLWFQSWINFHSPDEVLDWHEHNDSYLHGYLSIEPFESKTIFKNYEIENEPGLLYIGQSNVKHKVVLKNSFVGKRITIAFDVFNTQNFNDLRKKYNNDLNLSFIPVIL